MAAQYGFTEKSLEPVVKNIITDLSLENAIVHHKSGVSKGSGFLSDIHRFELEGKQHGHTKIVHLVAKVKPQNKTGERTPVETFWEIELFVYEHLFPEYEKIQEKSDTKHIAPRCYAIIKNEYISALVLEDLSNKGFMMCKLGKSLDMDHTVLTFQQMAYFHAASFVYRHKYPQQFEELLAKRYQIKKDFNFVDNLNPPLNFAAENIDNEAFQRVINKYKTYDFKAKVSYLMDGRNYEHAVITHGDLWANNLLFQYEGGMPKSVILLDYQISDYSSPLYDLYFALFIAVDESTRENHFMDLVNTYYEALSAQMRKLDVDPETVYPNEQFRKDLKTYSFTGMAITMFMLPIFANDPDEVKKSMDEAEGNEIEPDVTFFGVPKVSPLYASRIHQMARDIINHGLDELW